MNSNIPVFDWPSNTKCSLTQNVIAHVLHVESSAHRTWAECIVGATQQSQYRTRTATYCSL